MHVATVLQDKLISYLYYSSQLLCGLHTLLLIYWIIHVLNRLISLHRRKVHVEPEDFHKVFAYRENLIRYYLFIAFLICEFGYFFDYNVYGIFNMIWSYNVSIPVDIPGNCSLDGKSYLARAYSSDPGNMFLAFLRTQSTTLVMMMVWFYAVSLLHLTHAAKGILKPILIKRWVAVGVSIGIVIFTLRSLPWTSLITVFIQSAIGQMNILLAWYMARKFKVAMRSRVNEAYHTGNKSMNDEQEKLYRAYKIVIPVILIAFQLYYTSSNVFFNLYLSLETVTYNSCWFGATFGLHFNWTFSQQIRDIIGDINFGLLVTARLINIVAYSFLIAMNIWLIKKNIVSKSRKIKYRYQIFSSLSEEKQSLL